jgi:hypothetical protein
MEGMHIVGDILTKISVNCVLNLHDALLFTCLVLWVYPMCAYKCLYIYGYFLYMLHVYVYFYFSVNPCIYRCIFMFMFYKYISARVLFVYVLIACSSKKLWHSSIGCWVCYNMCRRENVRVLCNVPDHPCWSMIHEITRMFSLWNIL